MAGFENDVMYAKNADFTQTDNQAPSESNGLATDGQLWVGTTSVNAGGTHVNVGSLTSPNGSITFGYSSPNITATVTGGSTSVLTLTGNSGVATPVAGNINVITANATVRFVGSGSTLTQDFSLNNLVLGSSLPVLTSGDSNAGFGQSVFNTLTSGDNNVAIGSGGLTMASVTSGSSNVVIGWASGRFLTTATGNTLIGSPCGTTLTTGGGNTAVGAGALNNYTTGAANAGSNTAIGGNSIGQMTSGIQNTGVGSGTLNQISTGSNNIAVGYLAGNAHTLADSSNIDIGNTGTLGDSNTIRIGTQGAGTGQQNQCFIAGITGITVSNAAFVQLDTTTGKLGQFSSASVAQTITGDSGGALSPTAGNWNIFGLSGSKTSGSASTLTIKSPPFSQIGASATSVFNTGEFVTAAVTRTLPVSAGLIDGDLFIYVCTTAGALVIQAVGAQKIRLGTSLSSAAGSLTSTSIGDSITLRFNATDGFFYTVSSIGNWTIA